MTGRQLRRLVLRLAAAGLLAAAAVAVWVMRPPTRPRVTFPDGKRFAFTIVDDTDLATLERVKPIYDLFHRYGLRTTKTVWALPQSEPLDTNQGDSLDDPDYREYMIELQRWGFEIALHGVRGGSSRRSDVLRGLERFKAVLGRYPRLHVNHAENRDNVYWGAARWSVPPYRWLYALALGNRFSGQDPESPFFWGDLLAERVEYVNQFTFADPDLLGVIPAFPYTLSHRPYVNYWFPSSDGHNLDAFEALLSPERLDALERDGGICIVYSHLGAGSFSENGRPEPRLEARIKDVASRNGWFVPASQLLDHLRRQPGWQPVQGWRETVRIETLFLWTLASRGAQD